MRVTGRGREAGGGAVFIVNGRCGSTLLQSLLYETGEFDVYGEPPPGENAFVDGLVNRIGTINDEELEARLAAHYRSQGFPPASRILSKLPNYAFILGFLDRIVPDLKIVCLERSVVDVVRSLVAAGWLDYVYEHYLLGAPVLMERMLEDYAARTGQCPAADRITLVGLYTACRYRIAREALERLPARRRLRVEFVDWMERFDERSREILRFAGLDPSYAAIWTASRHRRVQHSGRPEGDDAYRTGIAELPRDALARLEHIGEVYGLDDLPAAAPPSPAPEVSR